MSGAVILFIMSPTAAAVASVLKTVTIPEGAAINVQMLESISNNSAIKDDPITLKVFISGYN